MALYDLKTELSTLRKTETASLQSASLSIQRDLDILSLKFRYMKSTLITGRFHLHLYIIFLFLIFHWFMSAMLRYFIWYCFILLLLQLDRISYLFSIIGDREDFNTLKSEFQLDMNNRKAEIKEEKQKNEMRIQAIK